ncbi:MAG: response regulator [Clostridiales bacterium]|nr:response regulator [Clostridiales bacterium]
MKYTIFVVDDMASSLARIKRALEGVYTVITLANAERMFMALQRRLPHLILLDVEMPDMSGFEAMEKLKASPRYATIPVIFLTGNTDDATKEKGFELGAADFITKPFVSFDLVNKVKNAITKK